MAKSYSLRGSMQLVLRYSRGCGADNAPALPCQLISQPEHGAGLSSRTHKTHYITRHKF
jgi:hypothetical protein